MTRGLFDPAPYKERMVPKPPFRWSFSQWETYNMCPQKWKFQNVMKLPRGPAGPAAARGTEIHDSVERYIQGGPREQVHEAVKEKYFTIFDEFRNHHNGDRFTELKMGFDRDWHLTPPTCKETTQCVVVFDAVRFDNEGVLHIGEWKSGKPKETHVDQRKLYALTGWLKWKPREVRTTTYYLEDTGPPERVTLKSDEGADKLKQMWQDRIIMMQQDEICSPKPQFGCRWCDYSKAKGGPCPF